MPHNYDRKDHFYEKAKAEGYQSRASYKLIELDKRFRLFRPGMKVLDLGCWPGGWLQVASEKVGGSGLAVGVDLVEIEELGLSNVRFIRGDARDEDVQSALQESGGGKFDLVLSDMSPKLSGVKEMDAAATVACAELAHFLAESLLKPGGSLVIKMFKNSESDGFVKNVRKDFMKVSRVELDATRKSSNEFYFVGVDFQKKNP
jgi:23S rRNA (uridine2552-2'-O)-methyltransferase